MSTREICNPPGLAPPTGKPGSASYSWVVKRGPNVFLAGMLPYNHENQVVGEDIASQIRKAFENLRIGIESVGGTLSDICMITVYTSHTDLQAEVFPEINPVYWEFFPNDPPARAVIGGVTLTRAGVFVELVASAVLRDKS